MHKAVPRLFDQDIVREATFDLLGQGHDDLVQQGASRSMRLPTRSLIGS
jgi:hypothetical protein